LLASHQHCPRSNPYFVQYNQTAFVVSTGITRAEPIKGHSHSCSRRTTSAETSRMRSMPTSSTIPGFPRRGVTKDMHQYRINGGATNRPETGMGMRHCLEQTIGPMMARSRNHSLMMKSGRGGFPTICPSGHQTW
jgi:hypothetical protein